MTPALEEARRLLRLAVRDGDTFALLLPLPKATMAALGFHAQQAVEKALKAACTRYNIEVRRTHDLAALGQAVLDHGTALPVSVDELRSLNPFAVEFRYDDEITSSMRREELDTLLRAVLSWAGTEVDG
ncbi:MAG: HEPN domain-containing protein [Comamonadaceae bacterium]